MKELKRGLSLFTFLMVVLFGYNISAANIIEVNDVNTLKSTLENTSCASNSIIEIKSNLNFNDIEGKDKDISIKCENVIIKGEEGKDIELKAADGYRHFKNDAKNAGLTIDNLTFSLNDSASFGGGILYLNESADLNIKNATFKGIIGKYYSYGDARNMKGSAIESNKSNILIENSKFLDNVGENTSGTVSNMSGNVVINNSSFKGNILLDTISPSAVRAKDAQISNSEFIGNISKASSGMGPLQTTTFNINNTLFKDNIATDKAGAMFAGGAGVVKNSSFINNKAAKTGGAIAAGTKPIEVINSTFVNNEANTGSAIEYAQGLILKQSTVVSNKASTTGSALNGGKDAGILNMYGSIVVGNIAGDKEVNLIEKNETKWVNKPEHHNLINQENDDIKLDAIFNLNDGNVVVEENEKFTPTINLKNDTSNPALDKIQTNAEWLTGDLLKDQLGVTRPQNDLTDIGASELVVKLSEDQIKAKEIDNKINALPQADKLTKADLEKTKAALKEYDDASNEVKSFVSETTKTKIEALKVKVAELDKDDDSQIKEEMQKVLDEKYTLNRLTDMVSEKTIDPNNVMNDVQLLSPKDLGVDNYQDYNFYVTSDSDNLKIDSFTSSDGTIKISYFRMYVYRPLEPEQHKDAKFKVTMYNRKANNVSVSKEFDIKIKPLTNKEIDKEVKFMDAVKADYFNGINQGINKDKDNIDKDMKNFHFALKDNDKVKWSYVTPNGTDNKFNYEDSIRHVRNGAPKKGDEFFSSNEDVIEHDKLIVHRPAKDTKVTISSTLTSHIYAKYADKYPEDQRFAQLKNQKVSVELFVLGSDEEQETRDPQRATINIRVEGKDKTLLDSFKTTLKPTDISGIVGNDSSVWLNTKEKRPVVMQALVHALEQDGHDPKNKDVLEAANGTFVKSILGLKGDWMYLLNNEVSNNLVHEQILKDGDVVTFLFLEDYKKQSISYFSQDKIVVKDNEEFELKQMHNVMDMNTWESKVMPVVGANLVSEQLQKDGTYLATIHDNLLSDANGVFKYKFSNPGNYYITSHLGHDKLNKLTRSSVKVIVKSSELDKLIKDSKAIKKGNYSQASFNKLQAEIKNATEVYANEKASIEEINQAITSLNNAKKGLKTDNIVKKGNTTYYYKNINGKKVLVKSVSVAKGKTTTKTYKLVKNVNKLSATKINTKYKGKNITTYYGVRTYRKNGSLYTNKQYYKAAKTNKYTKVTRMTYRSNGKKYRLINMKYKKGIRNQRLEYIYNKNGQLKSSKKLGKSYRYTTSYNKKGKPTKTNRKQYNAKGKLAKKAYKVKKRNSL